MGDGLLSKYPLGMIQVPSSLSEDHSHHWQDEKFYSRMTALAAALTSVRPEHHLLLPPEVLLVPNSSLQR